VNDTTNSNDIRLNDGRFVNHNILAIKHDSEVGSRQGLQLNASSSNNVSSSENASNNMTCKNLSECSFISGQASDDLGNVGKGKVGGSKDGFASERKVNPIVSTLLGYFKCSILYKIILTDREVSSDGIENTGGAGYKAEKSIVLAVSSRQVDDGLTGTVAGSSEKKRKSSNKLHDVGGGLSWVDL
jgi:hypothetical protein